MHILVYLQELFMEYGICSNYCLSFAKDFAHKVYFSPIRWELYFCLANFGIKFLNAKQPFLHRICSSSVCLLDIVLEVE